MARGVVVVTVVNARLSAPDLTHCQSRQAWAASNKVAMRDGERRGGEPQVALCTLAWAGRRGPSDGGMRAKALCLSAIASPSTGLLADQARPAQARHAHGHGRGSAIRDERRPASCTLGAMAEWKSSPGLPSASSANSHDDLSVADRASPPSPPHLVCLSARQSVRTLHLLAPQESRV